MRPLNPSLSLSLSLVSWPAHFQVRASSRTTLISSSPTRLHRQCFNHFQNTFYFSFSPLLYPTTDSCLSLLDLGSFCSTCSRELPLLLPFGTLFCGQSSGVLLTQSPSNSFPLPAPPVDELPSIHTHPRAPSFWFLPPPVRNNSSRNADLASGLVNSPAPCSFSGSPFHSGKPR